MGQAKLRGSLDDRIAQSVQRKREEEFYREATKRAYERMKAANWRQRAVEKKDVANPAVVVRTRPAISTAVTMALVAGLARLGGERR